MMRPYRVNIPQEALDDLAARPAATRFTRRLPGQGLGVPADRVRHLVEYWRDGYDWRAWERRINAHPQFLTEIDGLDVHFLHIRSARPDALPLILTHGWPMSVVEFLPLIDRLSDAFHQAACGAVIDPAGPCLLRRRLLPLHPPARRTRPQRHRALEHLRKRRAPCRARGTPTPRRRPPHVLHPPPMTSPAGVPAAAPVAFTRSGTHSACRPRSSPSTGT
ncbi:epoxide hydrolase N-terminal domain-containing protein [Nonomuraea sp. NPDC049684]|uniref:epoxide hydrolase N-terminal domain-containing protein n=1 Tax=unclassified Nonomuraea TaxID=2593643 RepID=UPI0037A4D3A5